MPTINTPLVELHHHGLPRVGPTTAKKLAAEIAVIAARPDPRESTVEDLLHYMPMRYEDRSRLARIAELQDGVTASIEVQVRIGGVIPFKGGRIKLYEFIATDGEGQVRAYWWNQIYLARVFHRGARVILYGLWKKNHHKGYFEVENPEYEVLLDDEEENESPETGAIHTSRRVPIYRKLGDIRTRQLRSVFHHLLKSLEEIPESIPSDVIRRHALLGRDAALRRVHFPADDAPIEHYNEVKSAAHHRLIFEEFLWLAMAIGLRRGERTAETKGARIVIDERIDEALRAMLPFELTGAQRRALGEIFADMTSDRPMNRLLQGDVGSGKTIVAVQAMALAIENGYQTALMVPTEILAEQHHRNIRRILAGTAYNAGLLTGSLRAKEKRETHERIASGELNLIVGTHALIQEAVEFDRLGLAVIDEQHRFGVLQRAEIRRRGLNPDVLVMTATPIPRSLAMTVYGDLDVSVIDELPPGRTPVSTHVRGDDRREKIYEFIREQIRAGRQAYVVYPIIEESEKLDLRNATEMYEHLQRDVFPEYRLGLLHGRMKPAEKEEVMSAFVRNELQTLVATTVIEVGVDVPNATVMLIEHAERFGLSQLHQLRGRVGRGAAESYCILLAQYEQTKDARERLKIMEETTDGFRIAERDLELRGPGEVMGTRQSGLPAFRVANLVRDQRVLETARREADYLLAKRRDDPDTAAMIERVSREPRFGLADVG
ncbi:MAG: ATP-dependent DNA helicase RecG [Acidobacteria bacterium]|nr:ATP-dependent DNA helicase RecG [Acidobacteriota bacterium]MCW5968152.1 ATP-dependent DNA helicase RecG [Blastocatellales bacterium]